MPPELLEAIKSGGSALAVVFAVLWWRADQRAERLQSKLETLSERSIVAMTEFKSLLQTAVTIFSTGKST